jgi:VWFA-related protein
MKKNWLILVLILLVSLADPIRWADPLWRAGTSAGESSLVSYAQGVVNLTIDDLNLDDFPTTRTQVTVRNENGVPIVGLTPEQFEIVEDGTASFPPAEVTAQVNPDAALSVVMVIDISGSMKGKPVEEAMRAANALIDQLSPQDRGAVIAFADEVNIDPAQLEEGKEVGFTTDKNALRNVVNFLDTKIGWDTPLYDAIYKGVKMVAAEPAGKRAVVVMTDGRDERDNAQGVAVKDAGSLSAPDDPISEANRHNIPIFSVGLVGLGGKIDTKYLARLAERTGGVYQEAPEPEELTPLFQNVADQLKQQYVLTYESRLPKDGNFHSLLVRVQLPQGQAFDETKIQPLAASAPEPQATPPTQGETQPPPATNEPVTAQSGEIAAQPTIPPAVAVEEEPQTWLQTIIDTFRDNPLLAVVLGAGVLLLLVLIIALIVVLLRGRGAEEEDYLQDYGPVPGAETADWTPEAADTAGVLTQKETEAEPGLGMGWPEPPIPGPADAQAPEPFIPPSGGTRIIERTPKHLAMLVDKSRPDQKYDLKGTTNIGRGRDNQIVIDEPTVSRHHAWIKAEGEDFMVFDVGSANGTFVNDERVTDPRLLQNGDVVRFGEARFIFTKVF